jgi:hypothetical protein
MADTFVCAMCGGTFEKDWSDDEAEVELKENFGENFSKDDCYIVCNDCYNKVKPSANPEFFANFQAACLLY